MDQTRFVPTLLPGAVAALLFLNVTTARGIVDLTPTPSEYSAEGIKVQQLIFNDDKQRISYDLPRGWAYRFDGGRIVLMPPEASFSEAVIQAIPLPKPQRFDEATVKALEQQVVSTLPPNSDAVTVIKSEQNSLILNGNLSLEVVVSYNTLGSAFQRSVLFLNSPGTQLIFKVSARKKEFERVYSAFRSSILTWQWLDPLVAGAF